MRRFSRPSTGTIIGALALFIALGGTAFAAGATVVNIADPTTPAYVAHVNSKGQLQVGGGPVTVTNTVPTELAPPSAYVHGTAFDLAGGDGCTELATPPSGKAMIVREVKISVSSDPSPGGAFVAIYADTSCSTLVADVYPPTIGETTLPFDPGLGIPAKSGLSVVVAGSIQADVYMDGYSVPSGSVPAAMVSVSKADKPGAVGAPPHQ